MFIIITLTALILLLFYLIISKIRIIINFVFDEKFSGCLEFNLYPFYKRINFPSAETNIATKPIHTKISHRRASYSKNMGSLIFSNFNLTLMIIRKLKSSIFRALKLPHWDYLRINSSGGLLAPDYTGQLYGAIESFKSVLPEMIKINYQPDFMAERLRGSIKGRISISLFRLIFELLNLIISMPLIKIISAMFIARRSIESAEQNT